MKNKNKLYIFLSAIFLILPGLVLAANFPLEIIQPQPNLTTANRFYKAYPGLEYSVNISVIGGLYPFAYELTSAPAGMIVDENTGIITWENPTIDGSPYTVTARVTDSENTVQSVSWTVSVTTSGFYFLDATNGNDANNGDINHPWMTLVPAFGGDKNNTTYAEGFLYFKSGTYSTALLPLEDNDSRVPMVGNFKPQVWLSYPGESVKPYIDMGTAMIVMYGGESNVYLDGLAFHVNGNTRAIGMLIESDTRNVVIRNNIFDGDNMVGWTGGNNALLMISAGEVGNPNYAIINNAFQHVATNGYGILGYSARNVLIADNIFTDLTIHPVGPKEGTNMWFIRNNRFSDNGGYYGINVQYSNSHGINSGNMEISHNFIDAKGNVGITINSNWTDVGDPVYIFRNTIVGSIRLIEARSTNGPFYVDHNVIIDDSEAFIIDEGTVDPSRLILANNLTGQTTDNIIDANGLLQGIYRDTYRGVTGWELGDSVSPNAPNGLSVL